MSGKRKVHVPATSDAAVQAKTGRDWATWFELLDRSGAHKLKHKQITELLTGKHAVPARASEPPVARFR